MIRVTFLHRQGRLAGFTCTGHAGFAEAGSDIVCSAVSALTQTAVLGLAEVAHIPAGDSVREDGYLRCEVGTDATDAQRKDAALLLDTLAAGLRAVDESYPGYLKFTDREV